MLTPLLVGVLRYGSGAKGTRSPLAGDNNSVDTAEDPPLPLSGVVHLLPRCTKQHNLDAPTNQEGYLISACGSSLARAKDLGGWDAAQGYRVTEWQETSGQS
jgi:hypothetical protein